MATRSKTPRIPAQRGGTASDQDDAAPRAKPKARRGPSAGQVARPQGQEASPDPAGQPASEMAATDAEREGRASFAAEAIKALGEMVAAGLDALAALRAEVREVNRRLDQLAAGRPQPAAAPSDANEYSFGRDRDPGDAVPPGVATMTPTPLTETDEAVLHTLEDLPKRTGRGKRGPRAKA